MNQYHNSVYLSKNLKNVEKTKENYDGKANNFKCRLEPIIKMVKIT